MNAAHEAAEKEAALDKCIDRMLAGDRWEANVPDAADDEVLELMAVAERIYAVARVTAAPEVTRRHRIRNRIGAPRNLLRQIAFYRLPYLPALWIRPEAC